VSDPISRALNDLAAERPVDPPPLEALRTRWAAIQWRSRHRRLRHWIAAAVVSVVGAIGGTGALIAQVPPPPQAGFGFMMQAIPVGLAMAAYRVRMGEAGWTLSSRSTQQTSPLVVAAVFRRGGRQVQVRFFAGRMAPVGAEVYRYTGACTLPPYAQMYCFNDTPAPRAPVSPATQGAATGPLFPDCPLPDYARRYCPNTGG